MGDRCMPWRGTAAFGVVFLAFVLYSIPDGMLRSIQFMMYGSSNFGKNGFAAMQNTEAIAEFNLAGKTIMVTGGNGGLGFETCRMLADTQATVLMVARSEERGLTEPLATNKAEYDAGKFTGMTAYARTKRMQMALAKYYARHEPDLFFCSMHPGWSETDGVKTSISGFYETFKSRFRSSAEGADTMAWLAGTQAIDKKAQNGALFRDRAVELEHFRWAGTTYSDDDQEAMYSFLKGLIKDKA